MVKNYLLTKHTKDAKILRHEDPLLRVPIAAGRYILIRRAAARRALIDATKDPFVSFRVFRGQTKRFIHSRTRDA